LCLKTCPKGPAPFLDSRAKWLPSVQEISMVKIDAATLAQQMLKLGLVTEAQLQESWEEVGQRVDEPEPLLRALERKAFVAPYQSQKLLKGELHGYFVGGYRILYKIASGSFGRV